MIYVNLAKKERLEVVDRLKKLGFKEELNEEYILDSSFPLAVDLDKKSYGCLTATTHAAIATVNKKVINKDDFYPLIEKLEEKWKYL